jgi:hypothetical protein
MILVKCIHCDVIDDEANSCILLTTELVRPSGTEPNSGEDVTWEPVTWFNNTEELLPNRPPPDKKLRLVPYPHGMVPVVIADKCRVGGMWGRQLFLFFDIYNMQADVSD